MPFTQIDSQWYQGEWLLFKDEGAVRPGRPTHKFSVQDRRSGIKIGHIKWWPPFRQYTFYPLNFPLIAALERELADFKDEMTAKHRAVARKPKRRR